MNTAKVYLWGKMIGAVTWMDDNAFAAFQYTRQAIQSGIEFSPFGMPLSNSVYTFPHLARNNTFRGLPGLIADSLPDAFGNSIIDAWLKSEGRTSFNPVERLCSIGIRGMGALEYQPAIFESSTQSQKIEVSTLVDLSNAILNQRAELGGIFTGKDDSASIKLILRVGTSAGGARAKAILAWNPTTNEFRSGQVSSPPGFEYWIMKFDGVSDNRGTEIGSPLGYGQIEYAYSRLVVKAGIEMMPCHLHREGGRSHFMTKRFDRTEKGEKIHMQSLGAMVHVDYLQGPVYSYEQTIQVMKKLRLPKIDLEQQVLRAMLNVVGRNLDDHVKNIAFLMNQSGEWRLSPAFDISYTYNPIKDWTTHHQMSINGKVDHFEKEDLISLAKIAGIKPQQAYRMLDQVITAMKLWPEFAAEAGVSESRIMQIQKNQRLSILD